MFKLIALWTLNRQAKTFLRIPKTFLRILISSSFGRLDSSQNYYFHYIWNLFIKNRDIMRKNLILADFFFECLTISILNAAVIPRNKKINWQPKKPWHHCFRAIAKIIKYTAKFIQFIGKLLKFNTGVLLKLWNITNISFLWVTHCLKTY